MWYSSCVFPKCSFPSGYLTSKTNGDGRGISGIQLFDSIVYLPSPRPPLEEILGGKEAFCNLPKIYGQAAYFLVPFTFFPGLEGNDLQVQQSMGVWQGRWYSVENKIMSAFLPEEGAAKMCFPFASRYTLNSSSQFLLIGLHFHELFWWWNWQLFLAFEKSKHV